MIIRYFLFIIIFILTPLISHSQWQQVLNRETRCFDVYDSTLYAGTYLFGIQKTTDHGANWNSIFGGAVIFDMKIVSGEIFAAWNNRVARSTNGGLNWSNVILPCAFIFSLDHKNGTLIAGTQDSGVYYSTNSGTNWSPSSLEGQSVRCILVTGNKVFAGTENSGIFVSTNNGVDWSQTSQNIGHFRSLTGSGTSIYAGSFENGLFRSSDDGVTWEQTAFDTGSVFSIDVQGNNIFIGGYNYTQAGIFVSTNNGNSWIFLNDEISGEFVFSVFRYSGYFFAGTEHAVYRRPVDEILNVNHLYAEIPVEYKLSQNYPNPFNPATKIIFSVTAPGNVKLIVYDHSGKKVKTILDKTLSPGTYENIFTGDELSSGVYYYTLITKDFTETKKMVLVK